MRLCVRNNKNDGTLQSVALDRPDAGMERAVITHAKRYDETSALDVSSAGSK